MNKVMTGLFLLGCTMLFAVANPAASSAGTITKPGRICGTIKGLGCPTGEYCFYKGNRCGIADMAGICKPRPTMCTKIYRPVCGCDGRTYSNDCIAASADVSVRHQGACRIKK